MKHKETKSNIFFFPIKSADPAEYEKMKKITRYGLTESGYHPLQNTMLICAVHKLYIKMSGTLRFIRVYLQINHDYYLCLMTKLPKEINVKPSCASGFHPKQYICSVRGLCLGTSCVFHNFFMITLIILRSFVIKPIWNHDLFLLPSIIN